jgi:hypothetical protein
MLAFYRYTPCPLCIIGPIPHKNTWSPACWAMVPLGGNGFFQGMFHNITNFLTTYLNCSFVLNHWFALNQRFYLTKIDNVFGGSLTDCKNPWAIWEDRMPTLMSISFSKMPQVSFFSPHDTTSVSWNNFCLRSRSGKIGYLLAKWCA